ncbi:MAG: helix-turn-helix domain-containing protein [Chloroflexota bacterium]
MPTTKADLILHPLRMRIIMTIVGKHMTAQQLATVLPDIAQATLYRHLNKLANGGILAVVEERPVRGTLEKVYALNEQAAFLGAADLADFTKDDHMRYFTAFVAILLGEFSQYLDSKAKPDLLTDGVAYTKVPIYMSDEEFMRMGRQMNEALIPVLQNQPAPGRKRRVFTTIVIPSPDEPAT